MSELTYFTVQADYKAILTDLFDAGIDPDAVAVTATVTFSPLIGTSDVILSPDASPRPTGFILAPVTGRIGTDARMATRYGQSDIRLVANTDALGLAEDLYYRADFTNVKFGGLTGQIAPITFQAPATDTVVNLIDVGNVPGQAAAGITRGPRGFSGFPIDLVTRVGNTLRSWVQGTQVGSVDISDLVFSGTMDSVTDVTAVGKAVARAVDQAAARAAINAYSKPAPGIPRSDLTAADQTSLGKADTAFQAPAFVAAGVDAATARGVIGAVSADGVKTATGGIVPIEKFNPGLVGFEAALLAAITEADANGGTVYLETAKTYTCTTGVTVTDKHVRINFNGAQIMRSAGGTVDMTALTIIHSHSTPQAVLGVTADVFTSNWPTTLRVNSTVAKIQVADATGWSAGDYAIIVSDDLIVGANTVDRPNQREGERIRIAAVIGNYLYAARPLRAVFTTNPRIARMTQKEVSLVSPWGSDQAGSPTGRSLPLIVIRGAVSPRVTDWKGTNLCSIGLQFEGVALGEVDGCEAYNLRTSDTDNAFGYGVRVLSSCDFTARNLHGSLLRHVFTTGAFSGTPADFADLTRYGSCWNVQILTGSSHDTGHAAFDFHEEAAGGVIDGCSVVYNHREPLGTFSAFQLRGRYTELRNSRSIGPGGLKMYGYDGGGFFRVSNYFHELISGFDSGTSQFGILFDNSATMSSRGQAELANVEMLARNCLTNIIQLNKASVRASNLRMTTYNDPSTSANPFRPIVLTDTDLYIDTLYVDLRGCTASSTRLFYLADSLSSVRVDRLVVIAGGYTGWGIGNFNSLNGTIEIGRLECDTLPASTLHTSIGTTATWSVGGGGDVILNQRSIINGLTSRTNAGAAVTLNSLATGRQLLDQPLTATRVLVESTISLFPGREILYIRTANATGAFTWTIGGDSLTTAGTWLRRMWTGTAWITIGKGTM